MNYLTTKEAAELLGIHTNSVKRTLTAQGVQPFKIGRLNAWPREDVERIAEDYDPTRAPRRVNPKWTAAARWNSRTTAAQETHNRRKRDLRRAMLRLRGRA